jgi:uncharacterized protein (TIRG00374 family)
LTRADNGTVRGRRLLLSAALGTALGSLFLWLVFRDADPKALLDVLRACNPWFVLLGLGAGLLAFVVKALRWVVLLRRSATLSVRASLAAVFVGSAGNTLVSHLGEVPRIMMAARASGAAVASLLASIVAERAMDLWATALLCSLILIGIDDQAAGSSALRLALGIASVLVLALVLAVVLGGDRIANRLEGRRHSGISRWRSAAALRVRQVVHAFQVFRSGTDLAYTMLLSMVMWGLFAACILCCLLAAGTEASFAESLQVLGVNVVALILPAPPGRVGTVQASFAVALAGTGMDHARVLAASIVYNALMTLPFWCIGGCIWWRQSLRAATAVIAPPPITDDTQPPASKA